MEEEPRMVSKIETTFYDGKWELYILKKSNAITFPKTKGEPCFVFCDGIVIDVTPYENVNCVPYKMSYEELEKAKKILEEKMGNKKFFGYEIIRYTKQLEACPVIFLKKVEYIYDKRFRGER